MEAALEVKSGNNCMVYIDRKPGPRLSPFVRMFWYCHALQTTNHRERVLPNGCIQLVINLAADHLTDCGFYGDSTLPSPPALIVGASGHYEVIDTVDMAELIGVVFRPGGFPALFRCAADHVSEKSISLDDLWSGNSLRERLAGACTAAAKLALLEAFLGSRLADGASRHPIVDQALWQFRSLNLGVAEAALRSGFSQRHFSQVFREHVGLSPKLWCRIRRFQTAVTALHSGREVEWAELALACRYYDQPHFANDFRAFSGIDPTTYVANRGVWRNHVPIR